MTAHGRSLWAALAWIVAASVVSSTSYAQSCPAGSTFYPNNYGSACTAGTCWATTPFDGSQDAAPLGWPGWYYSCGGTASPSPALPPPPAGRVYTYQHDPQNNLKSVDGPLAATPNDLTQFEYDALNRLTKITDALSGTSSGGMTEYGYDGLDQLTSVTDPRHTTTTYTIDGLGNPTQEISPDRGTTNATFDEAGNLLTRTDARQKTTTYSYDALNRLTLMSFQDGTAVSFGYDEGTNGKGRLTSTTWPGGQTALAYDPHGHVRRKSDAHSGGPTLPVEYGWNAVTGRLDTLTYPSGKVLSFGYDAAGRVSSLTVGSTLIATNIAYFPFGPPTGWTWGNGTPIARDFDLDGRMKSLPLGATGSRTVVYDDASRVRELNDPANPAANQSYGYDVLDRLTSWTANTSSRGYDYDPNGNRKSLTIGANTYQYSTPDTSNRLASTAGPSPARAFDYDLAGNIRGDGQATWTYNDRGRLASVTKGPNSATYTHDAFGQRVKKTGPTTILPTETNYFVYDEQGKLLGEYDGAGFPIQEFAHLGDELIAVLRGSTQTPEVFYVYADQVGRPWVITNAFDQVRWRWDTSPFGELPPSENAQGLGTFAFNLRFPGQYLDQETGLFYNYFRDYDPQTGRYVQSDLIGLAGGINTYGYTRSQPTRHTDPAGLNPGIGCLAGIWAGPVGCGVGAGIGTAIVGGLAIAAILGTPGDTSDSNPDGRVCKPAIPDVQPKDLCEELALAEAKAGAGEPIIYNLGDEPRLVALYGPGPWVKMQHKHRCFDGRVLVIHYFSNGRGSNVELKFV